MTQGKASLPPTPLRIPYGVADYIKIRRGNEYYVDKTHFLPMLENAGRFLLLIRPRRFGKSLLQSMMECYYDIARIDEFDELFDSTWILENPTAEKSQYMILRFDFSAVDTSSLLVLFREDLEPSVFKEHWQHKHGLAL